MRLNQSKRFCFSHYVRSSQASVAMQDPSSLSAWSTMMGQGFLCCLKFLERESTQRKGSIEESGAQGFIFIQPGCQNCTDCIDLNYDDAGTSPDLIWTETHNRNPVIQVPAWVVKNPNPDEQSYTWSTYY